jgi:hypothetical protein
MNSRLYNMRSLVCSIVISAAQYALAADCNDPAWAVREAHKPIYNNEILTKAITYSIEWPGNPKIPTSKKALLESAIGQALQSALTEWGSSLLIIRKDLDEHLKHYLENTLLCKPGSCQYTASPAVQVTCRQNASLLFLVYARGGDPFPNLEDGAVARAQVQGRTILLNIASYSFLYDQHLFAALRNDGRINLTAVIAHEMGHSFGLSHAGSGEQSIMLESFSGSSISRFPTARDARKFAEVLSHFIEASKPGEFEAVKCQGLKVSSQ